MCMVHDPTRTYLSMKSQTWDGWREALIRKERGHSIDAAHRTRGAYAHVWSLFTSAPTRFGWRLCFFRRLLRFGAKPHCRIQAPGSADACWSRKKQALFFGRSREAIARLVFGLRPVQAEAARDDELMVDLAKRLAVRSGNVRAATMEHKAIRFNESGYVFVKQIGQGRRLSRRGVMQ